MFVLDDGMETDMDLGTYERLLDQDLSAAIRAGLARSLALVDECGLTQLHVFPFSPRPGTPAAR